MRSPVLTRTAPACVVTLDSGWKFAATLAGCAVSAIARERSCSERTKSAWITPRCSAIDSSVVERRL